MHNLPTEGGGRARYHVSDDIAVLALGQAGDHVVIHVDSCGCVDVCRNCSFDALGDEQRHDLIEEKE